MFFVLSIYESFILISTMGILARSFCSRILHLNLYLTFFLCCLLERKEREERESYFRQDRIWAFWSRPRIRSPSPINQWGIPFSGGGGQPSTCIKLCVSLRLSDSAISYSDGFLPLKSRQRAIDCDSSSDLQGKSESLTDFDPNPFEQDLLLLVDKGLSLLRAVWEATFQ